MVLQGLVFVNDFIVNNPDEKYDENDITIKINDIEIDIRDHFYLILNKPKGYVSTTDVKIAKTVLELVPEKYKTKELFPAGRLDKDTTGLMIITDDGKFAHNILSPKKHIKKIYEVKLDIPVSEIMVNGFQKGINLNDGVCKSAYLEITGKYTARVTISEGRYHQIKRMFGCYKAKVMELNRICMGNLYLPEDLKLGQIRELTASELELIQEK